MYHDRYAAALECAAVDADVRLLLGEGVLHDVDEREDADWDEDNPAVRVASPAFSLVVTDQTLVLGLPRADGTYDVAGTLRASTDRALDWGERLFEHLWWQSSSISTPEPRAQY